MPTMVEFIGGCKDGERLIIPPDPLNTPKQIQYTIFDAVEMRYGTAYYIQDPLKHIEGVIVYRFHREDWCT